MFSAFLTILVLFGFVGLPLFIWRTIREQANAVGRVTFEGTRLMGMKSDSTVRWTYDVGEAVADVQTHIVSSNVDRTSSRSMVTKPGDSFWHRLVSGSWSRDEVVAVVAFARSSPDGKVIAFKSDGTKLWEMSYADLFGKPGAHFGLDWTLRSSYSYTVGGDLRTALVFQHRSEWPWLVVMLEDDMKSGRVTGRFLNAGEIDKLMPFATDTRAFLVIMGTSESRDASMLALVDALSGGGVSPEEAGSKFACADCAEEAVFRYFVFPRTEVNVASHAKVNRIEGASQGYSKGSGRTATPVQEFDVWTEELRSPKPRIDDDEIASSPHAFYTFDYAFERLLSSNVDDLYWKVHKYLERKGALSHRYAACPERNGPPLVRMWDAARGWRDLVTGGG
jgi:hypothetical protein